MLVFLQNIFLAVVTAGVPVLTAYIIVFIRQVGENAAANIESVKAKTYITEAAAAITVAVAATNQTYVDSLKNAGKFDGAAQKEAAQKALEACIASIRPAAQRFAEVRKQKNEATALATAYTLESSVEVTES